jgi:hypothetical protein
MSSEKFFFSTIDRDVDQIHNILMSSSYKHAERTKNLSLLYKHETIKNRLQGFIRPAVWLLLLYGCYCVVWDPQKRALVKYKNFVIGRSAVATAYRSKKAYIFKSVFLYRYIKSLFKCIQIIDSIEPFQNNIVSAFIDHGCYENGVYVEIFSKLGISMYMNDYPFGLFRWDPNKAGGYETPLQVPNYSVSSQEIMKGKEALIKRLADSDSIPYFSVDFEHYDSKTQFEYVIYTHSFTDAQCQYGYNGAFDNVLEWLDFTLKFLGEKRVCVKAHPAIYNEGYSAQVVEWDRDLFARIVDKYRNNKNIYFIDFPITNKDLLDKLSKDTILVSHHSNALLEGGALGYKCICAEYGNWREFKFFNRWETRAGYQTLLELPHNLLSATDQDELYKYYFILYFGENSFFNIHWTEVVSKVANLDYQSLFIDASCVEDLPPEIIKKCIDTVSKNIRSH